MAYNRRVGSGTYVGWSGEEMEARMGLEPMAQSFRDSRSSSELTSRVVAAGVLLTETYVSNVLFILRL